MSVRIEPVPNTETRRWDRAVDQSPQTTVFHQYRALTVLAKHFDATMHPLVGYIGQEPIGLLPVFGLSKGPFDFATSPPLGVEISAGPALLNFEKLKQRKAENRHQQFIDGCLEWIETHLNPDHVELKTPPRYDVRPLLRQDFAVTPAYTYVLDLAPGEDRLFERFSSDARRNIRNTADDAYEIREGDVTDIKAIVELVQRRFDELDKYHYLDKTLAVDLYSAAEEWQVRPYGCWIDGELASGMIVLEDDETMYRWQGGSKPATDVPVNDLLDWRIIQDGVRREKRRYDLVGAMLPRLCEYKSKFGPTPVPIYVSKKSRPAMKLGEQVYRLLPPAIRHVIGL